MWWENSSLKVINHVLHIGGKNAIKIAEEYGTPIYVTDGGRIEENFNILCKNVKKHLKRKLDIHYSVKANPNIKILKLLKDLGSSIDATSPFEVLLAERVGFTKEQIICTGTSFSNDDMVAIADKAIMNIDSMSQLKRYADVAKSMDFDREISIRINPGKGAGHCPDCITAGEDAKYGVPENDSLSAFKKALDYGLKPIGIHQHIGSGILPPDLEVFYQSAEKLLNIAGKVENACGIDFKFIDFGGGLGIPYKAVDTAIDSVDFGERFGNLVEEGAVKHNLGKFNVFLEPGRFIVGDSSILLVKVVDCNKKYVNELGVDAGFNILDRPARYKTYHEIVNVGKADSEGVEDYRVSGNLCESGDVFTESKHTLRKLPFSDEGDYLAILNAGAYGSSMSSNYNLRPRAREVIIHKGEVRVMRERDSFEDIIQNQRW